MSLELRTGIFGNYWGNTYDSSNALIMSQMKVNAEYINSYLQDARLDIKCYCTEF